MPRVSAALGTASVRPGRAWAQLEEVDTTPAGDVAALRPYMDKFGYAAASKIFLEGAVGDGVEAVCAAIVKLALEDIQGACREGGAQPSRWLSTTARFALRAHGALELTFGPYVDALTADPADDPGAAEFALRFRRLMCLQVAGWQKSLQLREGVAHNAEWSRVMRDCTSFLTAPLWLPSAPRRLRHLCMETQPKPEDLEAVFHRNGSPRGHNSSLGRHTVLSIGEVEALAERLEPDEAALLTPEIVKTLVTVPIWSILVKDFARIWQLPAEECGSLQRPQDERPQDVQDVQDVPPVGDGEYSWQERVLALLSYTVLMANMSNVRGLGQALGVVPEGSDDEVDVSRLCNFHVTHWPQSAGPMPRMLIPIEDQPDLAWADSIPLVMPGCNTGDLPGGLKPLLLLHFAPIWRRYFQSVADPGATCRLDTSDEYQLEVNLYSTGCAPRLRSREEACRARRHALSESNSVVIGFGKTVVCHLRKGSAYRSDTFNQTRCLTVMTTGSRDMPVVMSLSVTRGGVATFQSEGNGGAKDPRFREACKRRVVVEQRALALLLRARGDIGVLYEEGTGDAYTGFATEMRLAACDFAQLPRVAYRYFVRPVKGKLTPVFRHCIESGHLPTPRSALHNWPPDVFRVVLDELKRARLLRSGAELPQRQAPARTQTRKRKDRALAMPPGQQPLQFTPGGARSRSGSDPAGGAAAAASGPGATTEVGCSAEVGTGVGSGAEVGAEVVGAQVGSAAQAGQLQPARQMRQTTLRSAWPAVAVPPQTSLPASEQQKWSQPPPPPWTRETIPFPATYEQMEARCEYIKSRIVPQNVYESLRGVNHPWTPAEHFLWPPDTQAIVLYVCFMLLGGGRPPILSRHLEEGVVHLILEKALEGGVFNYAKGRVDHWLPDQPAGASRVPRTGSRKGRARARQRKQEA